MARLPDSSITPMSPVCSQPPASMAAAVASGSPQYPAVTVYPRTTTSPASPGADASPSAPTTRTSRSGMARPEVVATTSGGSPRRHMVTVPQDSVRP